MQDKPFIWITALVLSLPFLGGAAFTAYDVLSRHDILTNPESKVAVGWLFTGLMFLAMGVRGWGYTGKRGLLKREKAGQYKLPAVAQTQNRVAADH